MDLEEEIRDGGENKRSEVFDHHGMACKSYAIVLGLGFGSGVETARR